MQAGKFIVRQLGTKQLTEQFQGVTVFDRILRFSDGPIQNTFDGFVD
jgi:hypothetical protein